MPNSKLNTSHLLFPHSTAIFDAMLRRYFLNHTQPRAGPERTQGSEPTRFPRDRENFRSPHIAYVGNRLEKGERGRSLRERYRLLSSLDDNFRRDAKLSLVSSRHILRTR